jgi:hypothetical protein
VPARRDEIEESLNKQERLSAKIRELRAEEAESEENENLEQEKILNELNE